MKDLIGKKFRRNKYGLSLWEDEIVEIYYAVSPLVPISLKKIAPWDWSEEVDRNRKKGFRAIPMVRGKITAKGSGCRFELSEIIIYP